MRAAIFITAVLALTYGTTVNAQCDTDAAGVAAAAVMADCSTVLPALTAAGSADINVLMEEEAVVSALCAAPPACLPTLLEHGECAASLLSGRKLLSTGTPTIIDYKQAIRSRAGRILRVVPRVLVDNMTATDNMTMPTDNMTATDTMTPTDNMTATDNMTIPTDNMSKNPENMTGPTGNMTETGPHEDDIDFEAMLAFACSAMDCKAPVTANCSADEQAMLSFMTMNEDNITECPAACNDTSVLSDVCHDAANSYAECLTSVGLDSGMMSDEEKAMAEYALAGGFINFDVMCPENACGDHDDSMCAMEEMAAMAACPSGTQDMLEGWGDDPSPEMIMPICDYNSTCLAALDTMIACHESAEDMGPGGDMEWIYDNSTSTSDNSTSNSTSPMKRRLLSTKTSFKSAFKSKVTRKITRGRGLEHDDGEDDFSLSMFCGLVVGLNACSATVDMSMCPDTLPTPIEVVMSEMDDGSGSGFGSGDEGEGDDDEGEGEGDDDECDAEATEICAVAECALAWQAFMTCADTYLVTVDDCHAPMAGMVYDACGDCNVTVNGLVEVPDISPCDDSDPVGTPGGGIAPVPASGAAPGTGGIDLDGGDEEETAENTTDVPTDAPTDAPTAAPTDAPTDAATDAPTAAPTAAPTDAPTAAPVAAPVTLEAEAKVDGLPDDFDTNDAAKDDFKAGVAALAGVTASDVDITSATKVTARRHLLASTFDIKYTVVVAAAEAAAVTAKVSDPAQITTALTATPTLANAVVSTAAAAPEDTSGAASMAASMAAGVFALFAMLV